MVDTKLLLIEGGSGIVAMIICFVADGPSSVEVKPSVFSEKLKSSEGNSSAVEGKQGAIEGKQGAASAELIYADTAPNILYYKSVS